MKAKIFISSLVSFSLLFSGCSKVFSDEADVSASKIKYEKKIFTLQKESFQEKIHLVGNIESEKETFLSSKIGGRIENIFVNEGDNVGDGMIVVELYGEENYSQKNMAENSLKNTQIQFQNTKVLLEQQVENSKDQLSTTNENLEALYVEKENLHANFQEQFNTAYKKIEMAELHLQSLRITKIEELRLVDEQIDEVELLKRNARKNDVDRNTLKEFDSKEDQLEQQKDLIEVNYQAQEIQAQKQIELAKESLNSLSVNFESQNKTLDVQIKIMESKINEVNGMILTSKNNLDSNLQMLQTQIDMSADQYVLANISVDNTLVKSPFSGIVLEKFVEIGQVIAPGQPLLLVSNENYKIKTDISDMYVQKVEVGQIADVKIDGLTKKYSAIISKLSPKVDAISRKLDIEFVFDGKNESFKIGQFVRIDLYFDERETYFVPQEFVFSSFDGPYVYIDGQKQVVQRGVKRDREVEIWFEGIIEGIILTK